MCVCGRMCKWVPGFVRVCVTEHVGKGVGVLACVGAGVWVCLWCMCVYVCVCWHVCVGVCVSVRVCVC